MTISNTDVQQSYNGNGSTTAFSIPFDFQNNDEILVYSRAADGTEALKELTTDYTLNNPATTVTMLVAPAAGTKLIIKRATARTQDADYIPGGTFPAETHERALDKLTQSIQEVANELNKTLRYAITSPQSDMRLVEPVANSVLTYNSSANGFIAGPTVSEIVNAEGYAGDASDSAIAAAASAAAAANSAAAIAGVATNVSNLVTLSGVAADSTSLGTFTGTTIQDNRTNKQALQDLETSLETKQAGPLTGDVTTSGQAATLATVNSNVGSFGSATQVPAVTVNAKGLVTAVSNTAIQIAESQVTNLVSDLAGKQAGPLTGDVTTSGAAATIGANKVTNAMLATVATQTFKGRTTAATGNVEDLTTTQATAMLSAFVGDSGSGGTKGLVPAPSAGDAAADKFLKATGSWSTLVSAAPTIFGSRGTPRSIVAATGITSGASHMSTSATIQHIYIEGSTSAENVAATITAGTADGQVMMLIGRTDSKPVTLNSTTTNVSIRGPWTCGADDIITLRWDTTNWVEVSRNN